MSYREEMTPSSPPYSHDDSDDAFILRELSTPELEKRRFLYADDHTRDGSLDIDGFDARSFDTPWYRRRGSCFSMIRFAVFSIMIFISIAYYFWSIIPSASISCECRSSLSHSNHRADEPSDSVPPRPVSPRSANHQNVSILARTSSNMFAGAGENGTICGLTRAPCLLGLFMAEAAQMRFDTFWNPQLSHLDALLAQFEDIYSAESAAVWFRMSISQMPVLFLMNFWRYGAGGNGPWCEYSSRWHSTSSCSNRRSPMIVIRTKIVISVGPPDEIGLPTVFRVHRSVERSSWGLCRTGQSEFSVEDIVLFEFEASKCTPDAQTLQDVEKSNILLPQISLSTMVSALSPADFQDRPAWIIIQAYVDQIEDAKTHAPAQVSNKLAWQRPKATTERWRTCIGSLDRGLSWHWDVARRLRKLSIEKVDNIVQKIGYPTKSPNVMDQRTSRGITTSFISPMTPSLRTKWLLRSLILHRAWSKLGKPTDRNEWGMTCTTVNAYYNPPLQEIVFPPVFYGKSAPSFDSTGRHYDQTGNYTDWWDEKTVQRFSKKRAQCFVDQYSNFTNIADAGGLGARSRHWKKRDEASRMAHLPGLFHFSKETLFFIAYGKLVGSRLQAIYTDPHAPKFEELYCEARMANSREFNEAFNCPPRSRVQALVAEVVFSAH
ncbi:zincin [Aspergillus novofumigatus IBT 16806]|uniref:Zincin n=1 Tax=Aspergillus novofumigatus (strain IBT 16806) TaxID=1392255 RepID=A0A2I1BS04_ASPN1|nr:zincin [Aspergillus novofumigatus IBT 16806]PKX88200.1 zincin [Aspergillus novofumigatus IBT 16806]